MPRIILLGGGFGGLAAARELRSRAGDHHDADVVLVSASERFFMGFAKLWDLAGIRPLEEGTRPLGALAERGVELVLDRVEEIDPASVTVSTSSGRLEGDALLVALGSVPSPAHLELIAAAGGHNLYDSAALPAMHAALDQVSSGRVVVAILGGPFKCPPAPYEAALLVDEHLRRRGVRDRVEIDMVTPQPMTLPAAGADASRIVAGWLAERGVRLLDGRKVSGVDGEGRRLQLEGKQGGEEELEYSVLLAVPAEKAPPVIAASQLAGGSGFVEPDRHTLRTSFPRVYAVGDCTHVATATAQLPKAGVFAAAQGRVAAANIAADLWGGDETRFDGHGMCFLEVPGRRVATVEGDFFADPAPDVRFTEPSEAGFERKQAYEREQLAAWLG